MSLPYFPMYPSDFEAKTSHLTLAEDGAYNRLLRISWMTSGCTIPDDDAWIMRRLRCSKDEFDAVVRVVIDEYFISKDGRLYNDKLLRIYVATNEAHQRRVNAGAKGGKAKSLQSNDKAPSNAVAIAKQPEPEPEPEPEPVVKDIKIDFDIFWSLWPNKVAKPTAKKAWEKLTKEDQTIIISLRSAGFENWRETSPTANPIHASTFLNQRRWEDSPVINSMNGGHNGQRNSTPQGAERVDPALEQILRLSGL